MKIMKADRKMWPVFGDVLNETYCSMMNHGYGFFFKAARIISKHPGRDKKEERANIYRNYVHRIVYRAFYRTMFDHYGTKNPESRTMLESFNIKDDKSGDEMPYDDTLFGMFGEECVKWRPKMNTDPAKIVEKRLMREQFFENALAGICAESRIANKQLLRDSLLYYISSFFYHANMNRKGVMHYSILNFKRHYKFEFQYTKYLLRKYIWKNNLHIEDFISDDGSELFPSLPKILAKHLKLDYNENNENAICVAKGMIDANTALTEAFSQAWRRED